MEPCKTLSQDYLHALLLKRNKLEHRRFAVLKLVRLFLLNFRVRRAIKLLNALQ